MRSGWHRSAQPYRIDAAALGRQRALNRIHSAIILFGLMALAACMGFVLAGIDGVIIGALIAGAGLLVGSASGTVMFRQVYGAVTLGLLQVLSPHELAAVLAHEIAHIRHGDAFVMRLAPPPER